MEVAVAQRMCGDASKLRVPGSILAVAGFFCVFPSTDSLSDDNFVFRTHWSLLSKSDSNVLPKRTDVLYHVFANSCTVFKAAQRQPHSRNYVFIKLDADLFGKRGTSIIIATGLRELFLGSFLECQWFL